LKTIPQNGTILWSAHILAALSIDATPLSGSVSPSTTSGLRATISTDTSSLAVTLPSLWVTFIIVLLKLLGLGVLLFKVDHSVSRNWLIEQAILVVGVARDYRRLRNVNFIVDILNSLVLRTFFVREWDHSEGRRDDFLLMLKGSLIVIHELIDCGLVLWGVFLRY
jgi:hypothetical protein